MSESNGPARDEPGIALLKSNPDLFFSLGITRSNLYDIVLELHCMAYGGRRKPKDHDQKLIDLAWRIQMIASDIKPK